MALTKVLTQRDSGVRENVPGKYIKIPFQYRIFYTEIFNLLDERLDDST